MVQKIYSRMHPVLRTNTYHDVTDLVNHGMVKNTKTWISWKRNIIFLWIKKILNLCLRWHNLRSYCFLAEVTFKDLKNFKQFLKQDFRGNDKLSDMLTMIAHFQIFQAYNISDVKVWRQTSPSLLALLQLWALMSDSDITDDIGFKNLEIGPLIILAC